MRNREPRGRRAGCGRSRTRRGVTLVELLLVLALLVIVATMAYPAFWGPMENQKLRRAADSIRAIWGQAQVEAMKTGRMQMFRFQKDTNIYEVRPFEDQEAAVESSDTRLARPTTPVSDAELVSEPLPDGIRILQVATVQDVRTAVTQQDIAQNANMTAEDLNEAWSSPILFYPDGTSSNSQLLLANKRYVILLQLRGLTGVAQVSDLMDPAELGETP